MTTMLGKGKVLATLILLLFLSSITITYAAKTKTPFYYEAQLLTYTVVSQHWADETQIITRYIEECILKDNTDAAVGTISIDALYIINMKTGKATSAGQFVINFYSGETIEGTFTAKITYFTSQHPDIDGKFVGHGDMHVKGVIHEVPEDPAAFVLDGYSW